MLSYLHGFHAGNHADVLKHFVLVQIFDYMMQKPKAFTFLDCFAGSGMYDLRGREGQKTAEYKEGVARLLSTDASEAVPIPMARYLEQVTQVNSEGALHRYPGSAALASMLLREQDTAHLYELHPRESKRLIQFLKSKRRFHVHAQDGLKAPLAMLPPPSRRAVVLIDPPYEVKTEYDTASQALVTYAKRFPSGVFMLWYPVVERHFVARMVRVLRQSGVRNIHQYELAVCDEKLPGMGASGLFVINPPWQLSAQLKKVSPWLVQHLRQDSSAGLIIKELVPE